jgi:hypothetical protein
MVENLLWVKREASTYNTFLYFKILSLRAHINVETNFVIQQSSKYQDQSNSGNLQTT